MKKILLASSVLAMTASVAAAEVTVGGDGYYGIIYQEIDGVFINNTTGEDQNYAFAFDLDIDFTASGESDNGIVFGASIDADDTGNAQGVRGFDGEIFVSGAFGRLAMGDVDSAAEAVIGDLDAISLTGLGDFNENIFILGAGDPDCAQVLDDNGNPVPIIDEVTGLPTGNFEVEGACGQGPLALYTYDFEGFTGAIAVNDDEGYALGASYDGGAWSVGLAYENAPEGTEIEIFDPDGFEDLTIVADDDVTHIIGQASFTFANTTVKGSYGRLDFGTDPEFTVINGIPVQTNGDGEVDQYGISVESTFDEITVAAFYRAIDVDAPGTDLTYFYGVGVSYDLGGGLAVVAGLQGGEVDLGDDDPFGDDDFITADFGLDFAF